jgi:hypothetical protein
MYKTYMYLHVSSSFDHNQEVLQHCKEVFYLCDVCICVCVCVLCVVCVCVLCVCVCFVCVCVFCVCVCFVCVCVFFVCVCFVCVCVCVCVCGVRARMCSVVYHSDDLHVPITLDSRKEPWAPIWWEGANLGVMAKRKIFPLLGIKPSVSIHVWSYWCNISMNAEGKWMASYKLASGSYFGIYLSFNIFKMMFWLVWSISVFWKFDQPCIIYCDDLQSLFGLRTATNMSWCTRWSYLECMHLAMLFLSSLL